jgi:alkylation response protein AidB-like acyl-CoA dehydrogenase
VALTPGRRRIGAYALSEAQSGSDAFALTTKAVAIDDGFALTGRKLWITNAAEAAVFIVFATVDPAAGYKGITAFLVERDARLHCRRRRTSSASGEQHLRAAVRQLSRPARSGPWHVGQGYKVAIETLNEGRIGIGARWSAWHRRARPHPSIYPRASQFGKAVAEFQGVQFQIARAATDIEAARLLVYNAARLRDTGQPFLLEAAMCKLFASETAERVASLAVNLHGGNGFVKDYPVEKLYRDAKIGQIYEGTSNLQLQTIASSS